MLSVDLADDASTWQVAGQIKVRSLKTMRRDFRVVVANVLNYGLEVSKFELQSYYYIYCRTNTLGKAMKLLIIPAEG